MKIVYIANARIPTEKAHGFQIMKMCEAFAVCGHQVKLIVPARFNQTKGDPFEYYGIKRIFEIKKIFCLDLIPMELGRFGFWAQAISFLILTKIYLLFERYDVLYSREQLAGLFFAKAVLELHALPKKTRRANKRIWQKAKALVVLTGFIKNRLMAEKISGSKILVSPDAVDLEEFDIDISKEAARRKLDLPLQKKLIGYIGMLKTMGMEKGIDISIKTLDNLPANVCLVIVGGSKEDIEYYRNFSQKRNLEDRVLFIGKVPHKLIPKYLKAFDVLIAPFPENEHYKFYMSPLKIFEYMASGRPIVTTDLPSLREILSEENAFLARPGDKKSLAGGIERCLNSAEFSNEIARNSFEEVKKYTWLKRAEVIMEFIGPGNSFVRIPDTR